MSWLSLKTPSIIIVDHIILPIIQFIDAFHKKVLIIVARLSLKLLITGSANNFIVYRWMR